MPFVCWIIGVSENVGTLVDVQVKVPREISCDHCVPECLNLAIVVLLGNTVPQVVGGHKSSCKLFFTVVGKF